MSDFHAPCEDQIRATPGNVGVDTAGRTLTGYIAVFDSPTVINSSEGHFTERIMPGAFKKTLQERSSQVKIMFNHGMFPAQFENMPLGRASVLREDAHGLYVEVPLSRTSYNDDLIELINDGAVDGMSFRGHFKKDVWRKATTRSGIPERDVHEVALMEGGPVTWPAYEATSMGLRSAHDGGFTFAASLWNELSDGERDDIARILGTTTRTLDFGAGETTPNPGAAVITDSEPLGAHSGVTIIRRRVMSAADLLRSHI